MDVHRYTPQGRLDKTCGISTAAACAEYDRLKHMAETPFAKYYRITLVDRLSGDRIVRDTDQEFFGRQNIGKNINRYGWGE
jgi:hypothetical protein